MSILSRLFNGYNDGQVIVKNGKFSTTKNNHNCDKYNRPTIIFAYSREHLRRWLGDNRYKKAVKEANESSNPDMYLYAILCKENPNNLPSYLNPIYRGAYYQSKRGR